MPVALYAFTCGFLTLPYSMLQVGREGTLTVPVPSYLLVHPRGKVLFDSGLHLQAQSDAEGYFGKGLRYTQFHFERGEEIAARLEAVAVGADQIDYLINSHLHYDHSGGNGQLPNAEIVVQTREWNHARAVSAEKPVHLTGYQTKDFETGQPVKTIDGEHDLYGDGSIVCMPTYGHTPGHQSLRVRTEHGGEFVLCGDACYLKESLDEMILPGVVADEAAMLVVYEKFKDMQRRGSRIMVGHDPEVWKTVPQGPERLG